jgi:hypothetical protein
VTADGRIGMTRVTIDETRNAVDIRSDLKPEQAKSDTVASAILIFGAGADIRITRDGAPIDKLQRVTVGGKPAIATPLLPDAPIRPEKEMEQRLAALEQAMAMPSWPDAGRMMLVSWWAAGPFAAGASGPETVDSLDAIKSAHYAGSAGEVRWQSLSPWGNRIFTSHAHRGIDSAFGANSETKGANEPVTYFIATVLRSDREQTVRLSMDHNPGPRKTKRTAYLNGAKLDQPLAKLRSGDNLLVYRMEQTTAAALGDTIRFSIGEPMYGIPVVQGVQYITPNGATDANPVLN